MNEEMPAEGGSAFGGKQKILKYILIILTLTTGFLSWFSVYRSIKIEDSSTWIIPIIFFALYAIFMCLSAILIKGRYEYHIVVAISMFFSFVLAWSTWHLAILLISMLLMTLALHNIRKDLSLNVKINLLKSMGTGKFGLVLSLAILVSSQYFFTVKNMDGEKKIPELNTTVISSKIVEPVLILVDPNFKKMQGSNGITVDQFLIESQGDEIKNSLSDQQIYDQIPQDLPAKDKEQIKQQIEKQLNEQKYQIQEAILQTGREAFSEKVGHKVDGKDKIADVLAGLIDKKINDYFRMPISTNSQTATFVYISSIILFFTVWPLGSLLAILCFYAVVAIFKVMVLTDLVRVAKENVEKEVIV